MLGSKTDYNKKDYNVLLSNKVWNKTKDKLLDGISRKDVLANTNVVLENTRKALLADSKMNNLIYLPRLVLPLVRRVFPKLVAHDLVGVQPLTGPHGIIRFLDVYREGMGGNPDTNIWPWDATAGKRTHSLSPNDVSLVLTGNGNTTTFTGTLTDKWAEGTMVLYFRPDGGTGATDEPVAMIQKDGLVYQIAKQDDFTVTGEVNPKTLSAAFVTSAAPGAEGDRLVLKYKLNWEKIVPFDLQDSEGNQVHTRTFNKLKFDISRRYVQAVARKLAASYSFEFVEDYQAEFGENVEDKAVDFLTTTIQTEVDSEIINTLFDEAQHTGQWTSALPAVWTQGPNRYYETLMVEVNKMSNTIYQSTHVSGATFMVCSPITATYIQSMQQFTSIGNPTVDNMTVGVVKAGTLANQMDVYVTPLAPNDKLLLGFKGNKPESTGAIYSPYIPIKLVPVTYSTMPTILAYSRYYFGVLRPEFYGTIDII